MTGMTRMSVPRAVYATAAAIIAVYRDYRAFSGEYDQARAYCDAGREARVRQARIVYYPHRGARR
jgi:hypothetical protein